MSPASIISAASGEPDPGLRRFWAQMSLELFSNVRTLYEQIDTQFKARTNENGRGVQMMAFSVYSCGFFACYLCNYPNSKPSLAKDVQFFFYMIAKGNANYPS
jgi:hypothetical protein